MFVSVLVCVIASNRGRNGEPEAAFLEGGRASLRAVAAAVEITSVPTNRRHHFSIMRRGMMKLGDAVEKIEDVNPQSLN